MVASYKYLQNLPKTPDHNPFEHKKVRYQRYFKKTSGRYTVPNLKIADLTLGQKLKSLQCGKR